MKLDGVRERKYRKNKWRVWNDVGLIITRNDDESEMEKISGSNL